MSDGNVKLVLNAEHVTKQFGGLTAVNRVNLDIYEKELFAILGGSGGRGSRCERTRLRRSRWASRP